MRLGKIEKWILMRCYSKTATRRLPPGWRLPRAAPVGDEVRRLGYPEKVVQERISKYYSDAYWKYLFKAEILLNYFPHLPLSDKRSYSDWMEKFAATSEYKKALVTLTRTFNQLCDKRLVKWMVGEYPPSWTGLSLTDRGTEKAKELLNVNS